jgi:hypothetical protein
MGGLVTRAWIAGMAVDAQGQNVPYNNEVRRLIMVATPHYGVPFSAFGTILIPGFSCPTPPGVRSKQEQRMQFGSHFLWVLHEKWASTELAQGEKKNVLTIVGTADGFPLRGYSDGVVPVPSAALSDQAIRTRYVDRRHNSSIVDIDTEEHETFKLVKAFLLAGDPSDPDADLCNEPACRRSLNSDVPGMILTRLVESQTSNGINLRRGSVIAEFEPVPTVPGSLVGCTGQLSQLIGCNLNPEASTITITAVSPGIYEATITILNPQETFPVPLYGPATIGVMVESARTTVTGDVALDRARRP